MPYPTPAGGSAQPKEKDLPVFPGAKLLDAFVLKAQPDAIDGRDRTVQLYRTAAPAQEVRAYFDATLVAGNWALQTIAVGPDGVDCEWVPWAERQDSFPELPSSYIKVTTAYVGREGRSSMTPPPGFQGKGVPFAPPEPGYTWFWVITPR